MSHIASKLIWRVFFVISAGLACWFLGNGAVQWWNFLTLREEMKVEVYQWDVKRFNASKYALAASYRFEKGDKIFEGKTLFDGIYYLNKPSAIEAVEQKKLKSWKAWIDPKNPSHSSLEKTFSIKNILYGLICSGVFFYFLYLYFTSKPAQEEGEEIECKAGSPLS